MANNDLLRLAQEREKGIKRFTRWRPSVEKTYDDLIGDIKSGELKANYIPGGDEEWDQYAKDYYKDQEWEYPNEKKFPYGLGGFYNPNDMSIHIPDTEYGRDEALPHEIMHYFSGHIPGKRGVPNINKYQQLDMDLKGWLPSLHPGGRRPALPGKTKLGQWWNKNMATKSVEHSDRNKYHPWFDEHAFDTALGGHDEHNITRRNNMAFDNNYTDDEGLFQGGKYGRPMGRARDWWEKSTPGFQGIRDRRARNRLGERMEVEGGVPESSTLNPLNPQLYNIEAPKGERFVDVDQDFSMAREYALDFDPSNPNEVRTMQKRLNEAGFTDSKGEPLTVDGTFGPKTESALRSIQDVMQHNPGKRFGFSRAPEVPSQLSSPSIESTQSIDEPEYANAPFLTKNPFHTKML